MYLCMYHLHTYVSRTLVPEIRVHPEMLHVFQYIDVLMCVIYNCMHSTEQQAGMTVASGFSLLRQWSCSSCCPATEFANAPV